MLSIRLPASLYASLAALALLAGTAACTQETPAPQESAPEAPAGISASNGWMALPAVSGNPGAVYFTIRNDGAAAVTIRAADLLGSGSATLHETSTWNLQTDMQELFQVPVPAGEELVFEPGGKHVMVYDLDESLTVGEETELTLIFVNGDKISLPVTIRAPGDDGGMDGHSGMSGM